VAGRNDSDQQSTVALLDPRSDDAISPSDAKQRLQALVDDLDKGGYAAAAKCLADDLDALVVHLRQPPRHRRRWRSTNLLERSLGEVKPRTNVIGRFPGEEGYLTLVWAVLDLLITHQTNGIHFNQLDRQRLKRMKYEGAEPPLPEEVTAAETDHPEPEPRRIVAAKRRDPTISRALATDDLPKAPRSSTPGARSAWARRSARGGPGRTEFEHRRLRYARDAAAAIRRSKSTTRLAPSMQLGTATRDRRQKRCTAPFVWVALLPVHPYITVGTDDRQKRRAARRRTSSARHKTATTFGR
jgi:hypothetical protein